MNRQRLILFILLIALALAVTWSYFAMPRPRVAPSRKNAPGQRPTSKGVPGSTTPAPSLPGDTRILKLELLNREQDVFKGYRRDLFRPIFVDELKLMQNKAAALKLVKPPPLPPPHPLHLLHLHNRPCPVGGGGAGATKPAGIGKICF